MEKFLNNFNSIQAIQNLALYFIIYSIGGWVLETVRKTILSRKFVNSGFLHGPFCPIYGFGSSVIIIFISPFKGNYIAVFLVSFILMSLLEYLVALWLEKYYKRSYWDYSNIKFNIKGRVCLKHSSFWAMLGLIGVEIVHPFVQNVVNVIPFDMKLLFIIIVYVLVLLDWRISSKKIVGETKSNKYLDKIKLLLVK